MEDNTMPQEDALPKYAISFSWGDFIVQPSYLRGPTFDIVTPHTDPDHFKERSQADTKKKTDRESFIDLAYLLMDEKIVGGQYAAYADYSMAHKHWSNLRKYVRPLITDTYARKALNEAIKDHYLFRKRNMMLIRAHLARSVEVTGRTQQELESIQQALFDLFIKALHAAHIREREESLDRMKRKIEKSRQT